MTNPTTNFGWVMPSPTDLVTDLPADFEVFGQAVDTDFVDLLGGTTGQVLSKTTNTDLDFTWVTPQVGDITAVNVTSPITGGGSAGAVTIGIDAASTTVAGAVQLSDSTSTTSSVLASTPTATKAAYDLANAAIAKSTVTTAGDIIYRNATVPTRLGIGTAGQVLTVNSGATAPQWSTPASGATYIGANVFNSVSQNITTNVDTIVTFDSERNDTNAFHSTSTNTGRITIPTGYGGKYLITAQLKWNSGALANLYMGIRKNGTVFFTQPAFSLQQQYSFQEDLVAGDYLDISVFQNTGGTVTINANGDANNQSRQQFSVVYLGA
jgi:hypothetical protein